MKICIQIFIAIMLVFAIKINAQNKTLENLSKAPIIIEGRVLISNTFKDSVGNIWTSNKIFVTKIIKGKEKIDSDTIELILRGGKNYESGLIEEFAHLDWFSGGAGVYLCKESNHKGNFQTLELATKKPSRFIYINDGKTRDENFIPILVSGSTNFKSLEEFYSFLQEQSNITINDLTIHPLIQQYFIMQIKNK